MFEENYSYSAIAKKLSCSKGWVSKRTRSWKMNLGGIFAKSKSAATNKTGPPENSRRPQETAKNHGEFFYNF